MKDKYKAYSYILIVGLIIYIIGWDKFSLFVNGFVDSLNLPSWGVVLVCLIPSLPIAWWLRNERTAGSGVIGVAIGFIIGVLIGKRID